MGERDVLGGRRGGREEERTGDAGRRQAARGDGGEREVLKEQWGGGEWEGFNNGRKSALELSLGAEG